MYFKSSIMLCCLLCIYALLCIAVAFGDINETQTTTTRKFSKPPSKKRDQFQKIKNIKEKLYFWRPGSSTEAPKPSRQPSFSSAMSRLQSDRELSFKDTNTSLDSSRQQSFSSAMSRLQSDRELSFNAMTSPQSEINPARESLREYVINIDEDEKMEKRESSQEYILNDEPKNTSYTQMEKGKSSLHNIFKEDANRTSNPQKEKGENSQQNVYKDNTKKTLYPQLDDKFDFDETTDDALNIRQYTEEEIQELFNNFDKNNDNGLSFEELKQVFQSLNEETPDEDIRYMIDVMKTEDDSKITYDAFKEMMMVNKNDFFIKDTFDSIDKNQKGFVTPKELYSKFGGFNESFTLDEANDLVKKYGNKESMTIDYEGFKTFFNNKKD
ncbi:uncharacterized protein LOC126838392 isoform X2 [Adelges cooleyi]|uniref:uncharacterized protein LOC126838392 isoform X2 n=1 Tax=Adelges cooleyi TaxID=133065 RepID=UPI00217F8EC1|nr:uncharacterized protein LOC126838392 isoform X2 [Adelges cooleyi]